MSVTFTPPATRRRSTGGLFVMAGAVLWGTVGTAQALSSYEGTPVGLATARSLLTGLILLVVAMPTGALRVRGGWRFLVGGAVAMAAYQASFLTSLQVSGVSAGTLVAMGSAPLFAGVLGTLTGQRLGTRWLLTTSVAVAGLAVLLTPGVVQPFGAVTGLLAGASFAAYTWCSRRALDAGVPAVTVVAVLFTGAGLALAPFGAAGAVQWCVSPGGVLVVAYLVVVATVLPYLLWIRGMATTAPAAATTLALAEPLTAAVLAVARLGEPITAQLAAGAMLLGAGLLLTAWRRPAQASAR